MAVNILVVFVFSYRYSLWQFLYVMSENSLSNVGGIGGIEPELISSRGVITVEQEKPLVQDATQGHSKSISVLPKHMIESPWTLRDLCARESFYNTYSFSTANTWGTPISFFDVMDATMQSIGTMFYPFQSMNYWRGTTVLHFKMNGTQFHAGRLIAYFIPFQNSAGLSQNQQFGRGLATTMQHVFLDASTSGSAVMRIPFNHYYSYLPTKAIWQNDLNLITDNTVLIPGGILPTLGCVVLQAWQPLQATTGAATTLNLTVTVHIEDAEFYVPANEDPLAFASRSRQVLHSSPQAGVTAMPPTQEQASKSVPIMGAQMFTRKAQDSEQTCRSYRDVMKRCHIVYKGPLLYDTGYDTLGSGTIQTSSIVYANALNLSFFYTGGRTEYSTVSMPAKIMALYGKMRGSWRFKVTWEPPVIQAITSTQGQSFDLRPFVAYLPAANYRDLVSQNYIGTFDRIGPLSAPAAMALTQALSDGRTGAQTSDGFIGSYPATYGYGPGTATMYATGGSSVPFVFLDRNTPYTTIEVPFCSACDEYPIPNANQSIDATPGVLVFGFQSNNFSTAAVPPLLTGNWSIAMGFGDATRAGTILRLPSIMASGWQVASGQKFTSTGSDSWQVSNTAPGNPPSLFSEPQAGIFSFFQGLISRILPTQRTMDVLGRVVGTLGAIAALDKPGVPISGEPMLRQAMPHYAYAEDVEPVSTLALYPSHNTECDLSTFVTDQDEMSLDYLTQKMTAYDGFTWQTSNAAGTRLYIAPLSPMPEFVGTTSSPPMAVGSAVYPSLLSYVSSDFNYWTGGLKYRFQIAPTRFHQGRIFISLCLDDYVPASAVVAMTLAQATSQYGAYVDLADGITDFTFEVPYVSRFPRRHVPGSLNLSGLQANSMVYGNGANSLIGVLSIWVVNELVAQPGAPTSIDVRVWQGGAADYRLSHLGWNNISLMVGG